MPAGKPPLFEVRVLDGLEPSPGPVVWLHVFDADGFWHPVEQGSYNHPVNLSLPETQDLISRYLARNVTRARGAHDPNQPDYERGVFVLDRSNPRIPYETLPVTEMINVWRRVRGAGEDGEIARQNLVAVTQVVSLTAGELRRRTRARKARDAAIARGEPGNEPDDEVDARALRQEDYVPLIMYYTLASRKHRLIDHYGEEKTLANYTHRKLTYGKNQLMLHVLDPVAGDDQERVLARDVFGR